MNNSVDAKKEEVRTNIENMFESAKQKIKDLMSVCPDWWVESVSLGYTTSRLK